MSLTVVSPLSKTCKIRNRSGSPRSLNRRATSSSIFSLSGSLVEPILPILPYRHTLRQETGNDQSNTAGKHGDSTAGPVTSTSEPALAADRPACHSCVPDHCQLLQPLAIAGRSEDGCGPSTPRFRLYLFRMGRW